MTMYLCEAHAVFEQTHQRISYLLFCKLQPLIPLIGDSPKDQCKCLTHEYFLFKLDALEYDVRCLSLPYAVAGHGSEFERDSDNCYYSLFHYVIPENVGVGRKFVWKYTEK